MTSAHFGWLRLSPLYLAVVRDGSKELKECMPWMWVEIRSTGISNIAIRGIWGIGYQQPAAIDQQGQYSNPQACVAMWFHRRTQPARPV